jgi:hypothetical protein
MAETLGQSVDADLAAIKAHLAALEAKAAAEEKALSTWFKNNWLHIVNAGGVAVTVAKLFGKI